MGDPLDCDSSTGTERALFSAGELRPTLTTGL